MKIKVTALFTLVCFFVSSVFGQAAYASYETDSFAAGAADIVKASDSFIPFSAGKVSYAKNFNSKDIVINIQDLHCHGESQKNIAAILKSLEKYGFDKIYLEGAVNDVSTGRFINLRASSLGKLVVDDLLAGGMLSGAEYYSIKAEKPDIIKALDQADLYFENMFLLGNILGSQDEIKADIDALKSSIKAVKDEYYNSDLLRLDKFNGDFIKGKISAKKYYLILSKLAAKAGININAYTDICKYITLINEKGINYEKVTDELRVFINVLKENLPYVIYNELSEKSNNFSSTDELLPVFSALSDSYGICARYNLKHLKTFFKYIKTNENLNLLNFIAEEDMLIHDIGISLSQTPYERDIVFLDRFIKVLDGFFTAKITSGDYDYYLKNRKNFDETVSKYLGENASLANLKAKFSDYEKYHLNNIKRDGVFLSSLACSKNNSAAESVGSDNFTDLRDLMDHAGKGAGVKIVITGGFHSEGLRKRLSEQKTSFIIITPNVTGGVEKAENTYFSSVSEYFQVFTSALNKMPFSEDPLQIALPKIIASAINRAKINQMPLREIQDLINDVFAQKKSGEDIASARSLYEPVQGAEVTIDSITGDSVKFTVMYDYGYGKHPAYYVYDFKTKNVSLSIDSGKVQKMQDSFFHNGKEGYSSVCLLVQYGQSLAQPAAGLFNELSESAGSALSLMDPQYLHSSVTAYNGIIKEKNSPMERALEEPLSDEEIAASKNAIPDSFYGMSFKGFLTGHFKLMPDGAIIYQFDDPKVIEGFSGMRKTFDENYWYSSKIAHITIGRLVPGKYAQSDIDKINKVLDKYNKHNPFASVEFNFDSVTFGIFSSTGNENIKTEKIKFENPAESKKILQDALPEIVLDEIRAGIEKGRSGEVIENNITEIIENEVSMERFISNTEKITRVEVKVNAADKDKIEFTIKYFAEIGGFVEFMYGYDADEGRIYRIIDENAVRETVNVFFGRTETGGYKERYSDATIVVNNRSIADKFSAFYAELSAILTPEKAYLLSPEFYHFTVIANSSIMSGGRLPDTAVSKEILNDIAGSIPGEAIKAVKNIKGKLSGYFFLSSNGTIAYRVTNPEIINPMNEARSMFDKGKSWGYPPIVHSAIARLMPGQYTREDINKINALLDRYNRENFLADVEYSFDNIVFGQTMSTGNGFVNVERLDPQAKEEIARGLSFFDNSSRLFAAKPGQYEEASNVEEMLKSIENIAAHGLSGYEFTFDMLLPDNYADRSEVEKNNFKRKFISSEELYEGTRNVRDYLIANAGQIKQKAKENNIALSMHSFSIVCSAADKNDREVAINPHPGFNERIREMFDWQLEIAEALGIENITVHIEDFDIDGYVEFIKKAAAKKIKVNFENHLLHSDKAAENLEEFYVHTLMRGFMGKEKFIATMLAIKNNLTEEEQKYLGVTFDTSKALNSYLKSLPADADAEAVKTELAKVNLENLIDYYDAIADAGLTINNILLAQFSGNIADIRERGTDETGTVQVIYNKSEVDALNNPNLDMAAFLRHIRERGYAGALQQETHGIVMPSKNKKASILDALFKNKNTVWYKVYSFVLAPLWEGGVFHFLPFTAAAFFAVNPLAFGAIVLASATAFAFSHVIADSIIKKERPKLDGEVLRNFGLSVLFSLPFAVSYFLTPFAPVLMNIFAFVLSMIMHGIYNYTDLPLGKAVRSNDTKEFKKIIYSPIKGMPLIAAAFMDLFMPPLSMFTGRIVQEEKFDIGIESETYIPQEGSKPVINNGGFIGKFWAPFVYNIKHETGKSDAASLSVFMLAGEDDVYNAEFKGKFVERESLKKITEDLALQNDGRGFQRIMKAVLKALDGKAGAAIRIFEIDSAYTYREGFRENIISETGGFSVNEVMNRKNGIIAMRKELLENKFAVFHELMHWALAEKIITFEQLESAVTDTEIRERFFTYAPLDLKAAEEKVKDSKYKELEYNDIVNRYNSQRGHDAIRAFQRQYFAQEDKELTDLIRSSSEKYAAESAAENEKPKQESFKEAVLEIIALVKKIAVNKEKEEAAIKRKREEEERKRLLLAAEIEKSVKEKKKPAAKPKAKPEKKVRLHDQTRVYGKAKLRDKKTLKLDPDALKYLNYSPGKEVYLTSLPGGIVCLFVQPEALEAFEEGVYKNFPYRLDLIRRKIYPNTLGGVIDEKGILKLSLSKDQINTFIDSIKDETEFVVLGAKYGAVRIIPYKKYVEDISEENNGAKKVSDEYVRMIEEIIRATETSADFTHDRMGIALRFLNEDQKHITPQLKKILEEMVREKGLNKDQKAFAVLILAAISAAENPDLPYIKEQIKNAGTINADSLIEWLDMINNQNSGGLFSGIIGHLRSKAAANVYNRTVANALGTLTVQEQLKKALLVSENERWLLETERAESPGEHMLYGKVFVDAEMSDGNIDFDKLEKLRGFGIKPAVLTFSKERLERYVKTLCYVDVNIDGKTVVVEAYLRMENNIPVITMTPLSAESGIDGKDIYVKASGEVLNRLKNDYAVKGRFAYFTRDISLFEKIINFISNESLFRMAGKQYNFDLKAFSFDSKELPGFAGEIAKTFPDALDIQKSDGNMERDEEELNFYDISDNAAKTKDFMLKILKRLVLKNKELKSSSEIIVGEKINSKFFTLSDSSASPVGSYGINWLSSYFEKRMKQSGSPIMLLEDAVMQDNPALADIALIDWASVPFVRRMIADGKMNENDISIYGGDINAVREKSLAAAGNVLKEIGPEMRSSFEKFIDSQKHLKNISPAERFAQFVLAEQIRENLEKIHNNGGKVILSLNIPDKMTREDIIQTALFWQSIGFDGIRMNFVSEKMISDKSFFSAVSARMRKVKGDSIIMAAIPSSFSPAQTGDFVEYAAGLDIITALGVESLNSSLEEFKQKIWADINPLNEEYKSDTGKYFSDIQKAVAFGAGYIGVSAGTNIISADGRSVQIEIMGRITEMLSLGKSSAPDRMYIKGYKTGLQSKDELKTGIETKKLIVRELIRLQNGKSLKQGTGIDEESAKRFSDFLRAEPGIIKLRFIRDSLAENNENGIYAAAGYLRGIIEASLLSSFKNDNALSGTSSDLLRTLLLLDFSMPAGAEAYNEKEIIAKFAASLSDMSPDAMLQKMLEEEYGGEAARSFINHALYIYMLKNNGASIGEIIRNTETLMRAYLSEINFGYGMPINDNPQSIDEKWALGQIIEILDLDERKPVINKSVKDAVAGSVNAAAVSTMLKAA
ncbi:MAG: sugar phosphate isomerase/epimerase [Endomicrobia bacterium]|nr:sugar phosphate isomerase/epimerase [Endomicrobiia bacterium]